MNSTKEMGEAIEKSVFNWIDVNSPDSCFPNEEWDPLQLLSSIDYVSDAAMVIIASRLDRNGHCNGQSSGQTSTRVVPCITPLHIAVTRGRIDIIDQLIKANCDVNIEDQHGFTALHYAVTKRNSEVILLLIGSGASVTSMSKSGSTPLDLAKSLKFTEIEDILSSKMMIEKDPSLPHFKNWLCHLGAGEYVSKFLSAGYDLPFIVRTGLVEADLDCVGIPMSKLGIRKKILALHDLNEYYNETVVEEEEEEVDNEESDEDDDNKSDEEESDEEDD